jgi:hypothetical protein
MTLTDTSGATSILELVQVDTDVDEAEHLAHEYRPQRVMTPSLKPSAGFSHCFFILRLKNSFV